jgi:hypothetical protein
VERRVKMKQEQTDAMERVKAETFLKQYGYGLNDIKLGLSALEKEFLEGVEAGYAAALEAGKAVDENGLKPCPFCGSRAAIHRFDDMDIVECDACPAQMSSFALWNGRTGDAG